MKLNKRAESSFQLILGGIGIVIVLVSAWGLSKTIMSGDADSTIPSIIGLFVGFGFLTIMAKVK